MRRGFNVSKYKFDLIRLLSSVAFVSAPCCNLLGLHLPQGWKHVLFGDKLIKSWFFYQLFFKHFCCCFVHLHLASSVWNAWIWKALWIGNLVDLEKSSQETYITDTSISTFIVILQYYLKERHGTASAILEIFVISNNATGIKMHYLFSLFNYFGWNRKNNWIKQGLWCMWCSHEYSQETLQKRKRAKVENFHQLVF